MASVRSIARLAGVSTATVSRVLNNNPGVEPSTRDKVMAMVAEMDYRPAVGLKSTTNVAFVYTDESSLGSPFDSALLSGVAERLRERDLDLLLLHAQHSRRSGESLTQLFLRKGVRGAVVRTTARTLHVCEEIARERFPAVVAGERFDAPTVKSVQCSSRAASRQAAEHLLHLGHRRFALCTNVIDDTDHADRALGFAEALKAAGLDPQAQPLLRTPAHREGGVQLARRIAALPDKPTALFVLDPMTCAGLLQELPNNGIRVPEDMSVMGFDDGELRHLLSPEMTCVCQNAKALGEDAVALLDELVDGADEPLSRTHEAWLEVHRSCAASPAG
ncbi:LacI family DNA-binding transcriptional regulator [Phycisphaera mikurensis]|uniref:LacI family transcriptional regulator n=1 Tax=Phycisphaera mikurensis (strain NBRC 102666 / KCTC 22515 / FYK2301M01) TaxID=1142394 RepID=I0ID00_PHYMF|nr:LacI family DNA-binding transcriptional regulator [Phycisphaera mikurensis]MBB6442268.1 DNA-binding LacI/PurR family transcriptional regulator [Phycisphaera mikurensis]BAM03138.1 LacI family transcriptional regulator [Phycisphaera mikurensis NBRC 102666]